MIEHGTKQDSISNPLLPKSCWQLHDKIYSNYYHEVVLKLILKMLLYLRESSCRPGEVTPLISSTVISCYEFTGTKVTVFAYLYKLFSKHKPHRKYTSTVFHLLDNSNTKSHSVKVYSTYSILIKTSWHWLQF